MRRVSLASISLALLFVGFCLYGGSWWPVAAADHWLFQQISTQVTKPGAPLPIVIEGKTQQRSAPVSFDGKTPWLLQSASYLSPPNQNHLLNQSAPVDGAVLVWAENEPVPNALQQLVNWSDSDIRVTAGQGVRIGFFEIPTGIHQDLWLPNMAWLKPQVMSAENLPADPADRLVIRHSNLDQGILVAQQAWALAEGYTLTTPWWWAFALLALAASILLIQTQVATRYGKTGLMVATGLIWSALVVCLLLAAMAKQWFFPAKAPLVASLVSGLVLWLRVQQDYQLTSLQDLRVHDRTKLFRLQLDQQQFDRMYEELIHEPLSREQIAHAYELGLAFERKRSYDKAKRIYTMLKPFGHFDDSKTRLDRLDQLQQKMPDSKSTLVISGDQLQLPELGRYQLIRELGRGSIGVVYQAKDPKIDRELAIKTVRFSELSDAEIDSVKQRFFREAQAAGRLNHPNIVTVYDVGEEKDLAYIAMDYVRGEPLSKFCDESHLLDYRELLAAMAKVAHALHYAHEHDIIHRDIKPSNILFESNNRVVKVSDFGIARISDNSQTQTGIVLGSPSYMAPEQIKGEVLTGRSDIFSLGVSLYQLLTGHLPFAGETLPALAYAIANLKQRSVRDYRPELPVTVTRIVNKALQKDPEKRFADANTMAKALAKAALTEA